MNRYLITCQADNHDGLLFWSRFGWTSDKAKALIQSEDYAWMDYSIAKARAKQRLDPKHYCHRVEPAERFGL